MSSAYLSILLIRLVEFMLCFLVLCESKYMRSFFIFQRIARSSADLSRFFWMNFVSSSLLFSRNSYIACLKVRKLYAFSLLLVTSTLLLGQ